MTTAQLENCMQEKKQCPGFSADIEQKKLERDQLQNRAILTKKRHAGLVINGPKIKLRRPCAKQKKDTIESILSCAKDSKSMLKQNKALISKSKSKGIQALNVNGKIVTDAREIANAFNTFFVGIGNNLAGLIPSCEITPLDLLRKFMLKPKAENPLATRQRLP